MDDEPDAYQTYVLRLWRAKCQGKWQWHASIESLHTGECHTFASLEQLFAYWSEQCERQVPDVPDTCPTPVPRTAGSEGRGQAGELLTATPQVGGCLRARSEAGNREGKP